MANSGADKCRRSLACLRGGRPLCRVDDIDGPDTLFLSSRRPRECPYRGEYCGQQVCRCPERYRLFLAKGR